MADLLRTLPYELKPGIYWLGICTKGVYNGKLAHGENHQYLVVGTDKTLLLDTGFPRMWPELESQLNGILGDRPLDYIFPSHQELPHSANLIPLAARYPEATIIGDVRDYHLYYPSIADRLTQVNAGAELDLGGGYRFEFLAPVMKDLATTLWGYEKSQRVLFVVDAFQVPHPDPDMGGTDEILHPPGQCNMFFEELPGIDVELAAQIFRLVFFESRHVDPAVTFGRFEHLLETHPADVIASTHGFPIRDPKAAIPFFRAVNGVATEADTLPVIGVYKAEHAPLGSTR
ncbi:MAG: MBL fold metallo-hydrolase [Candidatus Dormibacteria bacterium]